MEVEQKREYYGYNRRTNAEIRNLIQASLSKRPMTQHELATDTKAAKPTIERNLIWLEKIGVVKRFEVEQKVLWSLIK